MFISLTLSQQLVSPTSKRLNSSKWTFRTGWVCALTSSRYSTGCKNYFYFKKSSLQSVDNCISSNILFLPLELSPPPPPPRKKMCLEIIYQSIGGFKSVESIMTLITDSASSNVGFASTLSIQIVTNSQCSDGSNSVTLAILTTT